MCGDCLQLVAALQLELGTDAAMAPALVAGTEWVCEGMAPGLERQVRPLASRWAPPSSFPAHHGSIFRRHHAVVGCGGGGGSVGVVGCLHSGIDAVSPRLHSASATWSRTRTRLPSCSGTW